MRPNSPQTGSCCPFCRLDVIVTLPVPLTGAGGMALGEAPRAEAVARRLWKKGNAGESRVTSCNSLSGRLELPPFTASAAALAEQSCQQAPHHISSRCCFMVKEMQGLPGSHWLHNSFRTPQTAQSPGRNVTLDGCIRICPLFLSELFPAVCLLLITD